MCIYAHGYIKREDYENRDYKRGILFNNLELLQIILQIVDRKSMDTSLPLFARYKHPCLVYTHVYPDFTYRATPESLLIDSIPSREMFLCIVQLVTEKHTHSLVTVHNNKMNVFQY